MLRIAAGVAERNLASRVPFLSAVEAPMGVDDPSLGNLAEPGKRIAVLEIRLGQRPDRFDADFLENVLDFELAPQACCPIAAR